jgi:hypothetical protein
LAPIVAAAVLLVSCAGDSAGDTSPNETPAEDFDSALGAGSGGGTLIFDGEEIPLESVVCSFFDEVVDVGTVSETGHRVLLGTNSSANPISAQILDPNGVQWFPRGVSGDEAQRDGDTFTSETAEYFNNNDDSTVEASFTVECP